MTNIIILIGFFISGIGIGIAVAGLLMRSSLNKATELSKEGVLNLSESVANLEQANKAWKEARKASADAHIMFANAIQIRKTAEQTVQQAVKIINDATERERTRAAIFGESNNPGSA